MKKSILILLFVSGSLAFAQQSPKPFQTIFKYSLESPNKSKMSLNMVPFKLEDFKPITNSLTEFQRKLNKKYLNPSDNMPIFELNGKFFLKIYKAQDNIDHKLRIFDLEKSKYSSRDLG